MLVLLGPRLQRWAAARHPDHDSLGRRLLMTVSISPGSTAANSEQPRVILFVGIMSVLMTISLQRVNGLKNVLATAVNAVAALIFMLVAWERIDWSVAALIALGSMAGGYVGARFGRRLSPVFLRVDRRHRRPGHRQDAGLTMATAITDPADERRS